MIHSKLSALAILCAAAGLPAQSDLPPDQMFGHFGIWTAPCEMRGVQAVCTSSWQQGLGVNHIVQEYSITVAAGATPIFSGRGLYRLIEGEIDGVWEDSRGAILDLSGHYKDHKLTVIWIDPQTEIGRSEYVWEGAALQVVDSVLTEDGWRDFMTVDYPAH